MINSNRKFYILILFFYSLQYFILINVCISHELQGRSQDLFSEKISSNIYARENSPNTRNLIDAVDIEQDEILDLENTFIHFPIEEKNSDSGNEDNFFNMDLFETINLEKGKSSNIKNVLGETDSPLMDSPIDPLYPSFENKNSAIHIETNSSSISLNETKIIESKDSYNPQPILNYSSATPNYLEGGFLSLLLEDDCSPINYENILPTTSNLMFLENEEHEKYIELETTLFNLPIEKPVTTINDNEDMSSVDEIEKISEKSYKRKGKKRNYEDVDNLDDQNIEKDISINQKKNYAYNRNYTYNKIGEDFVCSISSIFKMQINCLPDYVVSSLQKLRDILDDDNKSTYHNLEKKMNINILLLRDIIAEEIKKINRSDLGAIKNYYNKNIEGEKLVKTINHIILLFKHKTNHIFNKKEMHEKIKQILETFEDLANEHKFLRDLYRFKSTIANNFMYNKLFSFSFIQSSEVFKRNFELLKYMDKLIECVEKSIKNGFILRDRNYFCMTQKVIYNLHTPITASIRNNLAKLDNILKTLNLSYKDHSLIIQTIFYFLKKENEKNKKKLELYMNKPYKKNSLKAIYNFLLEEEKDATRYYNEASKIFNLNLTDKNKESILFDDLINNESIIDNLFSVHETLIKLIGGLFIKKQLTIIMNTRKLLLSMNSLKKRKDISYETKEILKKKHQSNLLSQIKKEKWKMEKIKHNIRNLHLFVTTKDDIKRIQVSNSLINKINGIISILRFICKITYKNEDKTDFNQKKEASTENILLALYYANQRLPKFTEKKIQKKYTSKKK
ncbi:fam-j protein [Plasmodium relictum]|uniref:Fam-j protein n=1 Tax=Plasmodium relictum TaxID=85471 RepID=A0A1J1GJZ4_PLARL|nr:fam-j protein [Plasmodium relictum]CRG84187.1 fam-j protein [Plasmodium relictum]